jgi:hypothetical protein
MIGDLEAFHRGIQRQISSNTSLSSESKSVVLFRAAIETGAQEMGLPKVVHLMSRLLTITVGIMAGDSDSSYEEILADLDTSDTPPH